MSITTTLLSLWSLLSVVALVAATVASALKAGPYRVRSDPVFDAASPQSHDIRTLVYAGTYDVKVDATHFPKLAEAVSKKRFIEAALDTTTALLVSKEPFPAPPFTSSDVVRVSVVGYTKQQREALNFLLTFRSPFWAGNSSSANHNLCFFNRS